ncbi:MAG: hypothetical protein NTU60_05325 [Candidatus Aminicenantes bacterium]|nr:hypothetical protein [Candidatus Aminicenantes bacterium]
MKCLSRIDIDSRLGSDLQYQLIMSRFKDWAERWKPAVRVRTQLLAAATLWTVVGCGLATAGLFWCFGSPFPGSILCAVGGIAAGLLKGFLIIRKFAERNTVRLIARGDGSCLGGFLSAKTWLLVALMMTSGILLRRSSIPRPVLGIIYSAVGTGLLAGCLPLWRVWRKN